MTDPSLITFRIRFPEFAATQDEVVDFHLNEVGGDLSASNWGDCYPVAVETLAAHRIAVSNQRQAQAAMGVAATVGTVQSGGAAGLSVSLALSKSATGSPREAQLSQTPYGLEYLALRQSCLGRGMVVKCR